MVVSVVSVSAFALVPRATVSAITSPSVGVNSSVTAHVAIGSQHVVAVGSNGTIWTWGSLIPGPTGVGSRDALRGPTQVILPGSRTAVDVASTYNASFAVASDGTVWGWGSLGNGLGDASFTLGARYTSPVQVTFPAGVAISEVSAACEGVMARSSAGEVFQWGTFWGNWQMSSGTPTQLSGISNATSISRGCSSSFAILQNGTAMAWGSNGGGRLGDGTTTDRPKPISISLPNGKSFSTISTASSHSLAIATDGSLYAWGGNANGQLGVDPNAVAFHATPRLISTGNSTAVSISASDSAPFSTVVTSTGSVLTWGNWWRNGFAPTPANLPTSDLGNRMLRTVITGNNGATFYVANDSSLWGKGWSWQHSTDLDGNCGANASDHPTWVNGRTLPARSLVRTISQGQFGARYVEDALSIRALSSGSSALSLDGTATLVGRQNSPVSLSANGVISSCYSTQSLTVAFDFDADGTFETQGVLAQDEFGLQSFSASYTPTWSGRRHAAVRVSNTDGIFRDYRFWMGILPTSGSSGGGGGATALPTVSKSWSTSLAIGTDGFIYGWGDASAAIGTASMVPKRLFPDSSTRYTKVSFQRGYSSSSYSVGAGLTNAGEVELWGRSVGTGLFFSGDTRLDTANTPYRIERPNGVARWTDVQLVVCDSGVFVLLLGDDRQVYVHGVGGTRCHNSGTRIPTTPASLAGLVVERFHSSNSQSSAWIGLRSEGKWWIWNMDSVLDLPLLELSSAENVGSFNMPIWRWGKCNLWYHPTSTLEIMPSGQVQSVRRQLGACENNMIPSQLIELSRTNVTSWSTRRAVDIQGSIIIADDGTVWEWDGRSVRMRSVDPRLPAITRFAGPGGFVVGADSSVWYLPPYGDGDNNRDFVQGRSYGNCGTVFSNDLSSAIRVFSSGQFGASYSEDRFGFQVDTPTRVSNNRFEGGPGVYTFRNDDMGVWSDSHLVIRPGNILSMHAYVHSSCDFDVVPTVEWDMNNDGVFEDASTVGAVVPNATPMATPVNGLADEVQYGGFSPHWRQTRSPDVDISIAGSRYVSVRLTSPYGTQTKRIALTVMPAKPPGFVGVSINDGSRFSSSSDVNLSLNWPEGATTALISNDGGFAAAQEIPLSGRVAWRLPTEGSGFLGTSVYVRFFANFPVNGSWRRDEIGYQVQDDIVLDLSPPAVSGVSASSNQLLGSFVATSMGEVVAGKQNTPMATATVSINATDDASGIAGMQVTSDPAIPGAVIPFSTQVRIPIDRERVAVRVVDNVGHWSNWHYVRVSGFTATPETPSVNPTPRPQVPALPAPAVPVAPVAPVAPQVPVPQFAPPVLPQIIPAVPAVPRATATAKLRRNRLTVRVQVPAKLARICKTKRVKRTRTTRCTPSKISVSVSRGFTRTVTAKRGRNKIVIQAKKKARVTVRLNGKVIQRIRVR